jgi:hypothetical protein
LGDLAELSSSLLDTRVPLRCAGGMMRRDSAWALLLVTGIAAGLVRCSQDTGPAAAQTLPEGGTDGAVDADGAGYGGFGGCGCAGASGYGGSQQGGAGGVAGSAGAQQPAVRFVGRFDTSKPAGPQFEWSGSEMQARFSGTEVSVHLDGSPNVFVAVVDGQVSKVKYPGGDAVLPLAAGLAAGEHEVRLYKVTEAFFYPAQFLGFAFGTGTLLSPPADPGRRLEVVGDSISAGYGIEGADQNCAFSADTENHYLTYESIAARDVGADLITLAWSGIGMVSNSGGDTTSPHMPQAYPLTMPDFPDKTWDFSKWIPQAVVINLGTNDFSAGDPGQPFVDAYLKFVTDMRGRYPTTLLYLATSPMMDGADKTQQKVYLQSVINTRAGAGDTKLKLLEFASQSQADGLGCDWHPNTVTHQKMAAVLTAALKADLGW